MKIGHALDVCSRYVLILPEDSIDLAEELSKRIGIPHQEPTK